MQAFSNAGLPPNVLQVVHLSPELTEHAIGNKAVSFVSFTGSVVGGQAVESAAVSASGFKGVALELGGKDPAYVREDANLDYTVPELVEGEVSSQWGILRIDAHRCILQLRSELLCNRGKQKCIRDEPGVNRLPAYLRSREGVRQLRSEVCPPRTGALVTQSALMSLILGLEIQSRRPHRPVCRFGPSCQSCEREAYPQADLRRW